MTDSERDLRLGLLSTLVAQAPGKLGRTAVMKLAFLLQTVKGLPLGYDFRLYTYGPFDSDVLYDLDLAVSLDAVRSDLIAFPSGYGYKFAPGSNQELFTKKFGPELSKYQNEISWALREFGEKSASDLELLTTIIYADREALQQHQPASLQELARKVREVKPRFAEDYIVHNIRFLVDKGLVKAVV
jgi:hypothetical protein